MELAHAPIWLRERSNHVPCYPARGEGTSRADRLTSRAQNEHLKALTSRGVCLSTRQINIRTCTTTTTAFPSLILTPRVWYNKSARRPSAVSESCPGPSEVDLCLQQTVFARLCAWFCLWTDTRMARRVLLVLFSIHIQSIQHFMVCC